MTIQIEKYLLFFLLAFCFLPKAFAQVDTEFWFAAPSLVAEHKPDEVHLVIVTYDEAATVSITQPAQSRTLLAARVIQPGSIYSFPISSIADYRESIETASGEPRDNGILIRSSAKVGAYYTAFAPNAEIYTLKGHHGAGTDFVVPMQRRRGCGHNAYCSIEVVATENNTTVTFVTTQPTNIAAAATTHTVTLQRGQTYAIRSRNTNTTAAQHLGGTRVTSDKPILVNTTDDSAAAGADLDLIGEQLVPTSLAGSSYIIPANNSQDDEYAYVYAIDDPVTIVDGNGTTRGTATPTTPLTIPLTKLQATYIRSQENAPFVCFHLTGKNNGTELSGTVLPSLSCSGSEQVSFAPVLSNTEVHLTILTRTENTGFFVINNIVNPTGLQAAFQPVPGAPDWSFCSCYNLQLALGESSFTIRNTEGVFHLGVLDNADNQGAVSYGFFSNYGQISLFAGTPNDFYRVGEPACFRLTAASEYEHIVWQGPNGDVIPTTDGVLCFDSLTMDNAGRYIVSATHREGCATYPDTIFLSIFDAVYDTAYTICEGDSVYLRSRGSGPYEWFADDEEMDVSGRGTWVSPDVTTRYAVDCRVEGVDMAYWQCPGEFQLTTCDSMVLWQRTYHHLVVGAEYTWNLHFSVGSNVNAVAPKVRLYLNGQPLTLLSVPNSIYGISYHYSFIALEADAELLLMAVSPHADRHFVLDTMTFTPALLATQEWEVIVRPAPQPTIQGPAYIVQGTTDSLKVDLEADEYRWSTGESTRAIEISAPGTYIVNVYSGDCFGSDTIYVEGRLPEPLCPTPVYMDTVAVVLCDSLLPYRWRGMHLSEPGLYHDTLRQQLWNGDWCDSLYFSLQLDTVHCLPPYIIYPDPACPDPVYADPFEVTICSSYLPYRWRGQYYEVEGVYRDTLRQTNEDGPVCDIKYFELQLTVLDCTPKEEDFRVELLNPEIELCDGDEPDFDLHVLEGELDHIFYTLPATPGIWPMTITCYSTDNKTVTLQATITIYYDPDRVFAQMWNDVLAIFSPDYSGYEYAWTTDYQWYRNGQPIPGATDSYYYLSGDTLAVSDYYQVELTRVDDDVRLLTCPYFPTIPVYSNAPAVQKVLQDTHLYIIRDNRRYTPQGQMIK